ncbi:L-idonate 5-dehydrogenase [Microbacterium sp. 18062]|uniref:L-idonate 5-dehydrogenase n=1 Tax=Microbacterium sp. 18062 TaxID=2681410 RepID=UPI00135748D6|nr:L-idonate 5-dehydrogenase [Microbacterium sp. 18062]
MRALRVHTAGDLRVDDVAATEPGPGEVEVRVEWGGICGSDLSYWRHGASGTAVLVDPLVLGHEIAGTVSAVGAGGDPALIGRRATVHPATVEPDSTLPVRLAGRENLHDRVRYFGSAAFHPHTDGGFRERVTARVEQLRLLPAGLDTLRGALSEPLAVAMHAVVRAGDVRGRDVLVNGAGAIGSLTVAALRHAGAGRITSADIAPAALGIARRMGADRVVDVSSGTPLPEHDLVFEASGAPAALGAVLRATSRGGVLVQVGNLPGTPAPAVIGDLVTREITWAGSYRFVDEITDAVAALGGGLDVTPVITHRFDLDRAEEAFRAAAAGSGKVMLAISTPSEETP